MMKRNRKALLTCTALAAGALLAAAGCSKDKGTNVTNGGVPTLDLPLAAGGGSATFTFTTAGNVPYKCGLHPSIMRGNSVTVSAASTTDSALVAVVGVESPGFSPSAVTIKVGGRVRWVNPDGVPHSVVND